MMRIFALLFSVFLYSISFAAEWGDTFVCKMTDFNAITYDGKTNNYTKEKFEFQLDKEKNAMVFGKGGWFHNSEYLLHPLFTYLDRDGWASEDGIAHILYSECAS